MFSEAPWFLSELLSGRAPSGTPVASSLIRSRESHEIHDHEVIHVGQEDETHEDEVPEEEIQHRKEPRHEVSQHKELNLFISIVHDIVIIT